jgi:PAS domain S-box-containing protein
VKETKHRSRTGRRSGAAADPITAVRADDLGAARWQAVVDTAAIAIAVVDLEGRIASINPAGARMFGVDASELVGRSIADVTVPGDYPAEVELLDALVAGRIDHYELEKRYLRGDGTVWLGHCTATLVRDDDGRPLHLVGMVIDVTTRREAEEARGRSDHRLRSAFDRAPVAMVIVDTDQRLVRVNQHFCDLLGYTKEQLLAMTVADITHPDELEVTAEFARGLFAGEYHNFRTEKRYVRGTGETIWVELTALKFRAEYDEEYGFGILVDVTARKDAEAAVENLTQALRTLAAGSAAIVRASEESALLVEMCRVIVEEGGYLHAWVVRADDQAPGGASVVASWGIASEHLAILRKVWADPADEPVQETSRVANVVPDVAALPDSVPWKAAVLEAGARSGIGLPLGSDDEPLGRLAIGADRTDAFDAEALSLLGELAQDLTYGITSRRVNDERLLYQAQMEESLESTIDMVATVVEMRDPYTAGHERRVARLAVAIATELGLEPDEVTAIRLAAAVHDVGKIGVPSEILGLPRRLTPAEFEVVKAHAQLGHDIVNGIAFTGPVPEMILQHHERLDGSGYPAGLAGAEILVGARIIAVADVVESMASHRPYRPALGIDLALAEIEENRGVLYDPDVVDACLRLSREQHVALSEVVPDPAV